MIYGVFGKCNIIVVRNNLVIILKLIDVAIVIKNGKLFCKLLNIEFKEIVWIIVIALHGIKMLLI